MIQKELGLGEDESKNIGLDTEEPGYLFLLYDSVEPAAMAADSKACVLSC
jgi:hypothetical protein